MPWWRTLSRSAQFQWTKMNCDKLRRTKTVRHNYRKTQWLVISSIKKGHKKRRVVIRKNYVPPSLSLITQYWWSALSQSQLRKTINTNDRDPYIASQNTYNEENTYKSMAGVFYSQFHIHETAFTEIVTYHIALVTSPSIILCSIVHRTPLCKCLR